MDIDLKKIKTILQEEFNVSIILVSEQNGEYNFRKLNISKEVANEFSDTISEKAIAIINDVAGGQKTLIEYNPGYKKDAHQIECMDISGTSINNFIESIPVTTGIEVFNSKQEDEDFINSLRFYMLLFETQNEVLYFFRKTNKKIQLNSNGILAVFKQGIYNKIEESVFYFDKKFDCFLYDKIMFIRNTYYFHLIFRYYEELNEHADEILNTLEDKVPIENMKEFKEICKGQLNMLAKVRNIASKEYFDYITMEHIKRTIKECELDIEVINKSGNEKIIFDPSKRWLILKLLDDDYLGSIMTNIRYEANSKKAIS